VGAQLFRVAVSPVLVVGEDQPPHAVARDVVLSAHAAIVFDERGSDHDNAGGKHDTEIGAETAACFHVEVVEVEPGSGRPGPQATFSTVPFGVEVSEPALKLLPVRLGRWIRVLEERERFTHGASHLSVTEPRERTVAPANRSWQCTYLWLLLLVCRPGVANSQR